ncbi:hypothetical protein MP228_010126 [Amoeboaphelidium protococcarum]|nr:hypothetical protein MP228_010126 [Amoeboaphelidium protococcarum]
MTIVRDQVSSVKALFNQFASITSEEQKLLSRADFVKALERDCSQIKSSPIFDILFSIADNKNAGHLSLSQFVMLYDLLNKPLAEYEVAFRLFDVQRRGKITREEFIAAWNQYAPAGQSAFDPAKSEVIDLYFGVKGKSAQKQVTFKEFCQLIIELQEDRLLQEFRRYDRDNSGYVEADHFATIIKTMMRHKISAQVESHLPSMGTLYVSGGSRVSWAALAAFQSVMRKMDQIERIVSTAADNQPDRLVSRNEFMEAAQKLFNHSMFTPIELDIIFHFGNIQTNSIQSITLGAVKGMFDRGTREHDYQSPAASISQQPSAQQQDQQQQQSREVKSESNWVTALRQAYNFTLGSVAGAVGATVVYPIDLVKTRMQNQRSAVVGEVLYKNSLDCFKKVIRNEGFVGLYSGLLPQLVGVAPEKAIKLTMNDFCRNQFSDKKTGKIEVWAEVLSGGIAGASQVVFTNPLEIVKIRLQVQGETKSAVGSRKNALSIVKELGLVGLYKGAGACLLRDIPFSAIYFTAYSHLKKDVFQETSQRKLTMGELLTAGAIAGIPAAYLTTPADVIKTRLQVEAKKGHQTYHGIRDAFSKILREEGVRAFFKGGPARIFRSSPQFGVTLMSYELFQQWLPFPFDSQYQKQHGAIVAEKTDGLFKVANTIRLLKDIDQDFGRVQSISKSISSP